MAYEYYLWASRLDLDDYNTNTEQGLHISAMSGTWLNIVCGFGGMCVNSDRLEFNPTIPDAWDSYAFKIIYRNSVIKVSIDNVQSPPSWRKPIVVNFTRTFQPVLLRPMTMVVR